MWDFLLFLVLWQTVSQLKMQKKTYFELASNEIAPLPLGLCSRSLKVFFLVIIPETLALPSTSSPPSVWEDSREWQRLYTLIRLTFVCFSWLSAEWVINIFFSFRDELREHLKNAPKMIMTQNQEVESSDSSSSSSSSDSSSSDSSSESDSDSSSDSSSSSSSSGTSSYREAATFFCAAVLRVKLSSLYRLWLYNL